MSEKQVSAALYYTRLNLKRAEVPGGPESDKRVKGAFATAYKLATKLKSPQEQQALLKAKNCLMDQPARLAYNSALNTYMIDDGWRIDNDFEASAKKRAQEHK